MNYTKEDFPTSPFIVFYEVTRACDLVCKHCRACAQPKRHPHELTNTQSKMLLTQLASFPKKPTLILTGGDPLKRDDIFDIVAHAVDLGLLTAMTPSATPLVTGDALRRLKDAGLSRLALSLDGADTEVHDSFRGVDGSYALTFEILKNAREAGLSLQINTTVTRRNIHQLESIAEQIAKEGIVLWSVFFLVPIGRGLEEERISAAEYEDVFEILLRHSKIQPYAIKTTEAHHYRRYAMQHGDGAGSGHPGALNRPIPDRIQRAPLGVNDGKGCMFVSHTGSVYPSGFMALNCGKFPTQSVIDIYQNSEIFQALRDPDKFHGKCGVCEYRHICGGSRARAFAVTRDPIASEPDCIYIPSAPLCSK